MNLVQILLPLCDATGDRFARRAFDRVAKDLSERFGGASLYARTPATGLWIENPGKTARDDIVVCEVMVETGIVEAIPARAGASIRAGRARRAVAGNQTALIEPPGQSIARQLQRSVLWTH